MHNPYNPYKKITASLLLFSHMLTSCYNPNIGIGKQALPTPDPADKQRQYAGEPHDKYPPKPISHTWTTADKHPITFTYHNGQWQAAIKEHAAYGSWQRRQLPVVFEPGLTLEDVVDSNPIEQKQLLHLCPSEEEPDQPGYVYVGREPMPQPRLLSSPAARQEAPPSQVGLAQQQVRTSPQHAQEQPGPQAVLALPGPVQEIGENPRSQGQLPTTPARVISKSLSTPGGEAPRQRVAQKQPTSTQQAPSRRALSWRNQHELLHSQRAAQAKRAQSAAMAKPVNEPAQTTQPRQAIVATPTQPPSLADKAPPGIASQVLLAQGGQQVRFMHQDGQWQARVMERIGVFSRVMTLPVACERHGDIAKALAALQDKPTQYTRSRIHVMHTKQIPYVPQFVYLGVQGLQGGGNGADEPSGSGEPQDEPAAGGQEGPQGREPSQPLAAPQDLEASLADAFFNAIRDNDVASVTHLLNQDSSLLEQTVARDNGQGAMRERTPLMYAAQLGDTSMVSLLVEHRAAVNQATNNGWTPLMAAAQNGHLAVAQYLVEHRAAVNQATNNGWTPLLIAVQEGHLAVAQYLVEQKADVNQAMSDGTTPLWMAAHQGQLEVAQFLVEHGALVNQATSDGRTPLFIAAGKGHLAAAQFLVQAGAAVDQAKKDGATPLHIAAHQDHLEVAQYLVGHGAAVNQAAKDGATPLIAAAYNGHLETAQYLVGQGAQVNQAMSGGFTPLYIAAQKGHLEVAQYLVEQGAAVYQANNNGATPLIAAAYNGHLETAQYLVGHGAAVDQAMHDGATPLFIAAQEGQLAVVQFLAQKGAAVDQAENDGRTPLLIAALKGHLEVVQYLVGHGAAVDQAQKDGATPFYIAAQEGHLEVAQFLVEHGAQVDQATKDGVTPLLIAAQQGHLETAQYLVGQGAAVNQANKDGRTPLHIAAQQGHLEVAQFLVEQGAVVNQAMKDGRTPLWIAAQNGDLACMRWLLQKGAHANISNNHHTPLHETASSRRISKNRKAVAEILVQEAKVPIDPEDTAGDTPLSWAAKNGDLAMVQFFVEKGATIDHIAHSHGSTPLLWAAKNGHQGVVAYLVEQGANIEAMNNKGATPLHVAAEKGHLAVVQYLQEAGANIEAADKEGRKPLWIAIEKGHPAVAQFLARQQLPYVPKVCLPERIGQSHAVPRVLELTKSKGPTQLELAQIEAKRLKKEIAEQYSRLPRATQEADSKVVHELTARLVVLLELERFCAPAQGEDGAKEYIARLREEHRTRWGSTKYGATVSKQFTALLEQAYGQELKRVVPAREVDKTPDGAARLAKVLAQLAALHQEQGAATGELSYYTDAAILYQNVLRVCEEEMKEVDSQAAEALGYQAQIAAAYSGLAKIRGAMLASGKGRKAGVVGQGGMSIAQLQEEISNDKQVLQALRANAKTSVAQLEALLNKQGSPEEEIAGEKAYIERSRALFGDIAKGVREFLGRLYQESEQALGPAPCKYTVMGLGSMALAQMTPYSDLEFAILMEEAQDAAAAREYREYLRQLTHLVHFRVINLGETTIPISKYGMSLDHLAKRGLNFDVGGKTPLGRKDKFYELIQPVAGMMRYLKNEENKIEHIDKNLPYILESTCYVHGDEGLYKDYEAMKESFLQEAKAAAGVPIHKARALKRLLKGVVEMDYSKPGLGEARPKQGDLAAFKPQLGPSDAGRLYDVKQEIYRLPDRLLYGLAMYQGILPKSGWDAVDQLASRGIIGVGAQEAAHHLQYAVSFATMLRLKTYLHHDQQAERVTMLRRASQQEAAKDVQEMFLLPEEALQAGGSLFKYYRTALPLHRKMEDFLFLDALALREQLPELLEVSRVDKDLDHTLIETKFWSFAEDYPSKKPVPFQAEDFYDATANTKGDIHRRLLDHEAAKECYEQALASDEQDYGPEAPEVAASLHKLGDAYQQLGDPKQAISCYERALPIYEQFYSPEHTLVAASLSSLGSAWNDLGNPKQAISYLERALAIREKIYGPGHTQVAPILNNLGLAWNELGDPKQAISYYERALPIYEQAYGPEHPLVAASLNNLGGAWNQLGDPKQAISYLERALPIMEQAYGPEHPDVATSLNNLGFAWGQLGDSKQAISYYERVLPIMEQAYGPEHPHVAMSLGNLGSVWGQLRDPNQAISYLERALSIFQKAYGPEHPHVATSLSSLGSAWNDLGDSKQAIRYYERALPIYEQAYGPEHPDVARSLYNLGFAWDQLGEHQKAIRYYERALSIDEQVYGPEHPDVAASLNNLGSAWDQLGEHQKAIRYYERALPIYEQAYGPEHPDVATILNNLGGAYEKLGDWKQAISYLERALPIYEKLYGPDHPHVAASLNHLGGAYEKLGDWKQAISYLERALPIYEKAPSPDLPSVATSLNNLGFAWHQLGEHQKAISYLERALPIYEKAYGQEHPDIALSLNNLGSVWHQLGDSEQAISYSERAYHIMKKAYGEDHPSTQTIKRNMEQFSGRLENNLEHQVGVFIQACVAGNESLAASMPMGSLSKDLYDAQGNPLICWMAQHEMMVTLEQVLKLGWNPNLPNPSQVYPLHYGAMKNPSLVRLLLPYADPFVQTAKGSTPAMVAKSKSSMEALSLLLPSITGLSLQDPAAFDTSYATCKAHFLATPTHSFEHLVQVFSLACHFKDWELAREVATRHNVRPILSQVTQQYPAAGKSLLACIDSFTEACKAGNDTLAVEIPGQFTFEKDLYDAQGNALIAWMAQHAMVATLDQVLKLGWNPNLPNARQVYPLHYGAMKNPSLTSRLLQAGAHPFVQTAKGNTPAQVARNKGKIATLGVLLPSLEGISFKDMAAFEESYQTYKQHFPTRHQDAGELLRALELALQLGDADLTLAIQTKQTSQNLLRQLIDQYPLAPEATQARYESMLP